MQKNFYPILCNQLFSLSKITSLLTLELRHELLALTNNLQYFSLVLLGHCGLNGHLVQSLVVEDFGIVLEYALLQMKTILDALVLPLKKSFATEM